MKDPLTETDFFHHYYGTRGRMMGRGRKGWKRSGILRFLKYIIVIMVVFSIFVLFKGRGLWLITDLFFLLMVTVLVIFLVNLAIGVLREREKG
jgi:hypothetical protein